MHRLDVDQLPEAARVAPGEEAPAGAVVGFAGAGVIDSDGEELQEATRGSVASRRDDRRHWPRSVKAGRQGAGFEDERSVDFMWPMEPISVARDIRAVSHFP